MALIALQIPRILEQYCGGQHELQLPGNTVRELIEALRQSQPNVYRCICNETGSLRQHINLFVNESLVSDRKNLSTPLRPGDVVSVFQAVSGG